MLQFNIHRFAKLARWSLTNDRKYHVKTFLQTLVIMTLVFLFLTITTVKFNRQDANYYACSMAVVMLFASTFLLGSSFMFYSMSGKRDMQALLLLPASNFEKYLMRYASWIILLPIYLVAFFAADLVQYVFGLLLGHEEVRFVTSATIEFVSKLWCRMQVPEHVQQTWIGGVAIHAVWLHSLYALGATFFRSRKYNWVLTTVVLILAFALLMMVLGWATVNATWWNSHQLWNGVLLMLTLLNFWLSYKFFCRQQVIGKFVNL